MISDRLAVRGRVGKRMSVFGAGAAAVALGVVVLMAIAMPAPALASALTTPVWTLDSAAAPRNLPQGGEGTLRVIATNLGDAAAEGGASPIVISDDLPTGLTATSVTGETEGELGATSGRHMTCTLTPVRCTFTKALEPYEALVVSVHVAVAADAASSLPERVSASGGGARSASLATPVTVGSGPTAFGVENYALTASNEDGTPDMQAGSHPFQVTSTLSFDQAPTLEEGSQPAALARDLRFDLPAGLIGNPTVIPQCTDSQFSTLAEVGQGYSNRCPTDTVIGVSVVTLDEEGNPILFSTPLFNLVPAVGEPARFGFTVLDTPVILDTGIRTGGDYGVTVTVHDIPETVAFLGSQVTFWGVPDDPRHNLSRGWDCVSGGALALPPGHPSCAESQVKQPQQTAPFLTLPTSCTGPLATSVEADSWAFPGNFTSKEYTLLGTFGEPLGLDGCNRLDFEPSISMAPNGQAASTPTGLTVGVHVPQQATLNPTGLAEADVRSTTVTLPEGVALNAAAADGLLSCSESEIALSRDVQAACPEESKIGLVRIKSPLLPDELTGAAYLATQDQNPFGSLVALYVVAEDPVSGTMIKLAGGVKLDPVTGQIVSTFENTPQLPFEDFKLEFFGGSRAPLGTPTLCGAYTTRSSIAPWSGNAPAEPTSTFDITSGPNGSPCPGASPPFSPSLTAGTTSIQAGGFTPFTMTVSREDGQQNIQQLVLHMPLGLSGTLAGLELCGEAQANAGSCAPNSLIGETTVSVGLGGDPFSVTGGKVYITGPYEGAPFGISVVVPAKAGPYNLGQVVVRGTIHVDPATAALTITTNSPSQGYAIPHILDGIPLQIKHVNFITTRPAFTFNPTDCNRLSVTGTVSSVEGASSPVAVPFQVTNCAVLGFAPKFAVSTSGRPSRANGASLKVRLAYPDAPAGSQANIARVKVELPKRLPSRLTTLQKACTAAQFESNPAGCPAASIVGHAKATTPILPVALEGPAYFVSHGNEAFPSLIVVLQGYGVTVDLVGSTFISQQGITSSTFKTVPDVPVHTFELTLPQGPYSALAANGSLCGSAAAAKLKMPTTITAQNGVVFKRSTKIAVTGCPKRKRAAHHARKQAKRGRRK